MIRNFALISIKPEYMEKILQGDKIYEFRRRPPRNLPLYVFFYETSPVQCIVGMAEIEQVIEKEIDELWDNCRYGGGIDEDIFRAYFDGLKKGSALVINNFVELQEPIDPKTVFVEFNPPQSFCYLDAKEVESLFSATGVSQWV
jgi:Uncharacterized conserved protein